MHAEKSPLCCIYTVSEEICAKVKEYEGGGSLIIPYHVAEGNGPIALHLLIPG